MNLNNLRKLNKHIKIKGIANAAFKKYGRIVIGYDFIEVIKYIEEKTPELKEGYIYIPSVKSMESLKVAKRLEQSFYGELPIQVGYFNGMNSKLNYLEYHKSSEILIAVTDMVIFLGKVQDIYNDEYELKKVEAFFIPEGVAIELYDTTLHSIPCNIEANGFKCGIISLRGTGSPLKNYTGEDKLLERKNKWLLGYKKISEFGKEDETTGLLGEDIELFILGKDIK